MKPNGPCRHPAARRRCHVVGNGSPLAVFLRRDFFKLVQGHGIANNYTAETRPDFVAPIYLAYEWVPKTTVPEDAPPMFILAATDDQLGLAPHSVALYKDWTAARKSAELHMLSKGGHGFGMRKQNLPSDRWIERFAEWLEGQGLMGK